MKLIREIEELKKTTDTLIMAHTYQPPEIIELADVVGDSFALAKKAPYAAQKNILMCGVRFMAESVKILSPEKTVLLPAPEATCPMAEQIDPLRVRTYKKANPDAVVVAYINTTAALKAECDVCVTSSSALTIVGKLDAPEILFIPDKNLGGFVKAKFPDKNIVLWDGYCPIHNALTEEEVLAAKKAHPDALLAMHPECPADCVRHADLVGSTAEIIRFAKASEKPVIIGTERGVADTLIPACPDRIFYYLAKEKLICPDMKKITPELVRDTLLGKAGEALTLPEDLRLRAKKSIDAMLRLGE